MYLSLREAGHFTGRSRQGVWQAIQRGELPADKDDQGRWQIRADDIRRVWFGFDPSTDPANERLIQHLEARMDDLRRELDECHTKLEAERQERERLLQVIEEQSRYLPAAMRHLVKQHLPPDDD